MTQNYYCITGSLQINTNKTISWETERDVDRIFFTHDNREQPAACLSFTNHMNIEGKPTPPYSREKIAPKIIECNNNDELSSFLPAISGFGTADGRIILSADDR